MIQKIIILIFFGMWCETAYAQCTNAGAGFRFFTITGEEFLNSETRDQVWFIAGYLRGISMSKLLGAPNECGQAIFECLGNRTYTQVTEFSIQYINDLPQHWHFPVDLLLLYSFSDLCEGLEMQSDLAAWEIGE